MKKLARHPAVLLTQQRRISPFIWFVSHKEKGNGKNKENSNGFLRRCPNPHDGCHAPPTVPRDQASEKCNHSVRVVQVC